MTEAIQNFFATSFGGNVVLATILISIIPIIELKGAIPFSMSTEIWGASALTEWQAFFYSLIGTTALVFLLALIYIPLIKWLKSTKFFKSLGEKIESKINKRKKKVEQDAENIKDKKKSMLIKLSSVFMFVAIPLPFTGVWTGACLAIALGVNYWVACGTVIAGNVVAGLLVLLLSHLFGDSVLFLVYILLGVVAFGLIMLLVRNMILKIKEMKRKKQDEKNLIK